MGMNNRFIAPSILLAAVGLVATAGLTSASARMSPQQQKMLEQVLKMHPGASKSAIEGNMARVAKYHLVKCYGVNAVAKNDCAAGVHSCAGQATQARDPQAFVLLPGGDCQKIAGGSLSGPM